MEIPDAACQLFDTQQYQRCLLALRSGVVWSTIALMELYNVQISFAVGEIQSCCVLAIHNYVGTNSSLKTAAIGRQFARENNALVCELLLCTQQGLSCDRFEAAFVKLKQKIAGLGLSSYHELVVVCDFNHMYTLSIIHRLRPLNDDEPLQFVSLSAKKIQCIPTTVATTMALTVLLQAACFLKHHAKNRVNLLDLLSRLRQHNFLKRVRQQYHSQHDNATTTDNNNSNANNNSSNNIDNNNDNNKNTMNNTNSNHIAEKNNSTTTTTTTTTNNTNNTTDYRSHGVNHQHRPQANNNMNETNIGVFADETLMSATWMRLAVPEHATLVNCVATYELIIARAHACLHKFDSVLNIATTPWSSSMMYRSRSALTLMADVCMKTQAYEQAISYLFTAIDTTTNVFFRASILNQIGCCFAALNDEVSATKFFDKSVQEAQGKLLFVPVYNTAVTHASHGSTNSELHACILMLNTTRALQREEFYWYENTTCPFEFHADVAIDPTTLLHIDQNKRKSANDDVYETIRTLIVQTIAARTATSAHSTHYGSITSMWANAEWEVLQYIAYLAVSSREFELAESYYEELLRKLGQQDGGVTLGSRVCFGDPLQGYAVALLEQQQYEICAKVCNQLLSTTPQNAFNSWLLALTLAHMSTWDLCYNQISNLKSAPCLASVPAGTMPQVLLCEAIVLYKLGRKHEALSCARNAAINNPSRLEYIYTYCSMLAWEGRDVESATNWITNSLYQATHHQSTRACDRQTDLQHNPRHDHGYANHIKQHSNMATTTTTVTTTTPMQTTMTTNTMATSLPSRSTIPDSVWGSPFALVYLHDYLELIDLELEHGPLRMNDWANSIVATTRPVELRVFSFSNINTVNTVNTT